MNSVNLFPDQRDPDLAAYFARFPSLRFEMLQSIVEDEREHVAKLAEIRKLKERTDGE